MKTPFAPQGTPLIKISAAEIERPSFVAVPNLLNRTPAADTTNFTSMARMLEELMKFAPSPWRQYWAVNALTPEVKYLGEFSDPADAMQALTDSGFLHREEMFLVNCTGAANLLVSGKELQAIYQHPKGHVARVHNNVTHADSDLFFEASEDEAMAVAKQLFNNDEEQIFVVTTRELRKWEDYSQPQRKYIATFEHYNRGFGSGGGWSVEIKATSVRDAQDVAGGLDLHPDDHLISVVPAP